eukprot:311938_1
MNIFFVFDLGDGTREIVTPPLTRGDILPGVTRRSIIELAQGWDDCVMSERNVTMDEVEMAVKEGRIMEAFGAGTAAVVAPLNALITRAKIWKFQQLDQSPKRFGIV